MISRRSAIKKMLICCGALTIPISRIVRAHQKIRWVSLITPLEITRGPNHDIITAVNTAIEEINAQGGVLKRKVEHDAYEVPNGKYAVNLTKKLLAKDEVNFIGAGFLHSVTEKIYRLSCEKQVIFTGYNRRPFPYDPRCPFYFSAAITPFQMGKSLSYGIFQTFKESPKTYAVIGDDFSWAHNIGAGINYTAKELGFQSLTESFLPLAPRRNYQEEIKSLKKIRPSFLFVPASWLNLEGFALQSTELGLKDSIKIVFPFNNIFLARRAKPEYMADIFAGLPWYWRSEFPGVEKFVDQFFRRKNRVPSYYAAQAYTMVRLILDVANEIKSIKSKDIVPALENRSFNYLKGEEMIRKQDHVTIGQLLLGIGKSPSEIKKLDDFFEILKVVSADCIVDAC